MVTRETLVGDLEEAYTLLPEPIKEVLAPPGKAVGIVEDEKLAVFFDIVPPKTDLEVITLTRKPYLRKVVAHSIEVPDGEESIVPAAILLPLSETDFLGARDLDWNVTQELALSWGREAVQIVMQLSSESVVVQ